MALQLDDLDIGSIDLPASAGTPMVLPLTSIEEDPTQPRHEFDAETLRELADSIVQYGVLQPVSVRPHPGEPGRWMLNFGARRLRACRLAGKADIPAFVDEAPDRFKQVIENEQRDAMRPMDLAAFVREMLSAGLTQTEIARRLGKSQTYVTFVCALIDPPGWVISVYREGKCQGLKELYELRRLYDLHPGRVTEWVERRSAISRSDIVELRSICNPSSPAGQDAMTASSPPDATGQEEVGRDQSRTAKRSAARKVCAATAIPTGVPSHSTLLVFASLAGRDVRVIVDELPGPADEVFVQADDGRRSAVKIDALHALRLAHVGKSPS